MLQTLVMVYQIMDSKKWMASLPMVHNLMPMLNESTQRNRRHSKNLLIKIMNRAYLPMSAIL